MSVGVVIWKTEYSMPWSAQPQIVFVATGKIMHEFYNLISQQVVMF